MSEEFEAIFENGVLRPLQPVGFREHELVVLTATSVTEAKTTEQIVARQKALLLAFAERAETSPEAHTPDDLSNRDHDQIIYGGNCEG